jgi:hypothetical protein
MKANIIINLNGKKIIEIIYPESDFVDRFEVDEVYINSLFLLSAGILELKKVEGDLK